MHLSKRDSILNKQLNKEREEILDQIAENFNQQVTEDGKTYKELRQQITDEINKLNDELSDEAIEVQRESLSQFLTDTIEINKQIDSYINERKNKLSELSAQLNSLDNEEANQRLKINQEIDDKIAANNLKKEQAVAVARQNIWKQTSAKEKATLFKRNAEELADRIITLTPPHKSTALVTPLLQYASAFHPSGYPIGSAVCHLERKAR